ncbi:hypothetical protein B0H17DRAFT_1049260 [Mycena rosella]|uniref:Zinc-ribbon 15 domain-containing protein n=1 Tax=Mycena rosella TaxID=1033263 RepID=A0AAD7DTB2_MYCRO|nr:hypothetical protein B0H17DRAFT_1049260 [Mycena rosella]
MAQAQATRTGESGLFTSTTFRADSNSSPKPARICPQCKKIGSVSTGKAQTLFISLIPVKSQTVWRCKKCGWNTPVSANWEPAVSSAIGAGRPSVSHEVNPMYRMAEGWYRPPSDLFAGQPEPTPVQLGSMDGQ